MQQRTDLTCSCYEEQTYLDAGSEGGIYDNVNEDDDG